MGTTTTMDRTAAKAKTGGKPKTATKSRKAKTGGKPKTARKT